MILLFTVGARGAGPTCADILSSGGYKTILRQAQELGVVDSQAPLPLEHLYLKLKEAEYEGPRALNLESFSKHFAVGDLGEAEQRQFFLNSVHALYIRVARLWRLQEVRTQVGPVMHPETEAALANLLKQNFSPWGLEDRDLTPESAREHFRGKTWITWPWMKIAGFLTAFRESGSDFSRFWDAHNGGISFEFYHRLRMALEDRRSGPLCCLSEPGCVTCPHNRRWRKKVPSISFP